MPTLSELYPYTLWISAPLFFVAAASLIYCIRRLIRSAKQAQILDLPLKERQEIEFAQAGPVVLSIEGPRFTTRFGSLSYALSTSSGAAIRGRRTVFRNSTSGLLKVTMDLMTYNIPEPGRYHFKVEGLRGGAQEKDAEHRLVFSKPQLVRSIGYVLGITLSAVFLIGSLVFSLLRLSE